MTTPTKNLTFLGALLLMTPLGFSEEATVTKSQRAMFEWTDGKKAMGTLISLNSKEVKCEVQGRTSTYSADEFAFVKTLNGIYVYDRKSKAFTLKKRESAPVASEGKKKPSGMGAPSRPRTAQAPPARLPGDVPGNKRMAKSVSRDRSGIRASNDEISSAKKQAGVFRTTEDVAKILRSHGVIVAQGFGYDSKTTRGGLLSLSNTKVAVVVDGWKYEISAEKIESITLDKDLTVYWYDRAAGRFTRIGPDIDDSTGKSTAKGSDINVKAAVYVLDPPGEVRGIIKRVNDDQSIEFAAEEMGKSETRVYPRGAVYMIARANEMEHVRNRDAFQGHSIYVLIFREKTSVFEAMKLSYTASPFGGAGGKGDSVPFADLVREWKALGDTEVVKVEYTWTPELAAEQRRKAGYGPVKIDTAALQRATALIEGEQQAILLAAHPTTLGKPLSTSQKKRWEAPEGGFKLGYEWDYKGKNRHFILMRTRTNLDDDEWKSKLEMRFLFDKQGVLTGVEDVDSVQDDSGLVPPFKASETIVKSLREKIEASLAASDLPESAKEVAKRALEEANVKKLLEAHLMLKALGSM